MGRELAVLIHGSSVITVSITRVSAYYDFGHGKSRTSLVESKPLNISLTVSIFFGTELRFGLVLGQLAVLKRKFGLVLNNFCV